MMLYILGFECDVPSCLAQFHRAHQLLVHRKEVHDLVDEKHEGRVAMWVNRQKNIESSNKDFRFRPISDIAAK